MRSIVGVLAIIACSFGCGTTQAEAGNTDLPGDPPGTDSPITLTLNGEPRGFGAFELSWISSSDDGGAEAGVSLEAKSANGWTLSISVPHERTPGAYTCSAASARISLLNWESSLRYIATFLDDSCAVTLEMIGTRKGDRTVGSFSGDMRLVSGDSNTASISISNGKFDVVAPLDAAP